MEFGGKERKLTGGASKSAMCPKNYPKRSHMEISFLSLDGIEAGLPTLTTLVAEDIVENQRQLVRNVGQLEVRECAQIRRAAYQQKFRAYYNQRAKTQRFSKGEWVIRRIQRALQKGTFSEQ